MLDGSQCTKRAECPTAGFEGAYAWYDHAGTCTACPESLSTDSDGACEACGLLDGGAGAGAGVGLQSQSQSQSPQCLSRSGCPGGKFLVPSGWNALENL